MVARFSSLSSALKMRVETYSSFAYPVEPRLFEYDGTTHHVQEIQRAWRTPAHIHFYVRDAQDEFFELTYNEPQDDWTIRMFGKTCPPKITNR